METLIFKSMIDLVVRTNFSTSIKILFQIFVGKGILLQNDEKTFFEKKRTRYRETKSFTFLKWSPVESRILFLRAPVVYNVDDSLHLSELILFR